MKKYKLIIIVIAFISCDQKNTKKQTFQKEVDSKVSEQLIKTESQQIVDSSKAKGDVLIYDAQNIKKHKATVMRTIGLIGGTSWHSTIDYYRFINQMINETFGNNTNPPLIIFNLNQFKIFELQKENNWDSIADMLIDATKNLENAGAECVLFCANTPYKVYDIVTQASNIPIIHIADKTGEAIQQQRLKKVGLIGTKYTMEGDFITKRIENKYGVKIIVPDEDARLRLHEIIETELVMGVFDDSSKQYILSQIKVLQQEGAEGIILGCTEFPLIVDQADLSIPVFNTALLHAESAVDFILRKQ